MSSEMRSFVRSHCPYLHILDEPTNQPTIQPIFHSVRPSANPPLCESSHVPRIRGQGCLSSFVAPSIPRSLARTVARTAHENEASERVCSAYNGALSNSEINRREREVTADRAK